MLKNTNALPMSQQSLVKIVDAPRVISNPVVYSCYEKANRNPSSFEHRSHRNALPQGQRSRGAKPLANHLAPRGGARRPKRSLKSPGTARRGFAPWPIATMTRVPKVSATAAMAILGAHASSRTSSKPSSIRRSRSLQPMGACGPAGIRRPLDPEPNGAPGACAAGLGVSQATEL